jgi:hypothetical protein
MRIVLAVLIALAWGTGAKAAIITMHYTGTYTVSFSGNYWEEKSSDVPTPFSLTFVFNTDLAQPNDYSNTQASSYLRTTAPWMQGFFPVVGNASFSGGEYSFWIGNYDASASAQSGSAYQGAVNAGWGRGGFGLTETVAMQIASPLIPGSITESYSITEGLIGQGGLAWAYSDTILGGGVAEFTLTPTTLHVTTEEPAPVPIPPAV